MTFGIIYHDAKGEGIPIYGINGTYEDSLRVARTKGRVLFNEADLSVEQEKILSKEPPRLMRKGRGLNPQELEAILKRLNKTKSEPTERGEGR